jgi:hypothetical protein
MSITITGIITMLLSQVLPLEEVGPVVDAVALIVTTSLIWYGRYRQGDITWWGKKVG